MRSQKAGSEIQRPDVPEGHILSQDPKNGMRPGRADQLVIQVWVSAGSEETGEMPDLENQDPSRTPVSCWKS